MNLQQIYNDINSPSIKNIILDTDTYNEVDDQFALVYAMESPERINLLSITAAPFSNKRAATPEDGMNLSYNEIFNVLKLARPDANYPVYRGATSYLKNKNEPVESDAVDNIIETVMNSDEFVYICAIGALTNVASAIIKCPELIKKTAVIWLGGVGFNSPHFPEFNLKQDILSAQVVYDSEIPLIIVPTFGVSSSLVTTIPEMEHYFKGKNNICNYLNDILSSYAHSLLGWSKVLWDISVVGLICKPKAFDMVFTSTPYISSEARYCFDDSRHQCIYVRQIKRDPVFADMLKKLIDIK